MKRNFLRAQFWLGSGNKFQTEGEPVQAVFDCIKALTFEQRQQLLQKLDAADFKAAKRQGGEKC